MEYEGFRRTGAKRWEKPGRAEGAPFKERQAAPLGTEETAPIRIQLDPQVGEAW